MAIVGPKCLQDTKQKYAQTSWRDVSCFLIFFLEESKCNVFSCHLFFAQPTIPYKVDFESYHAKFNKTYKKGSDGKWSRPQRELRTSFSIQWFHCYFCGCVCTCDWDQVFVNFMNASPSVVMIQGGSWSSMQCVPRWQLGWPGSCSSLNFFIFGNLFCFVCFLVIFFFWKLSVGTDESDTYLTFLTIWNDNILLHREKV